MYWTGLKGGKIDGWVDGKKQVLIETSYYEFK